MRSAVLSATPALTQELDAALERNALLVVGLCAAWCNTCGEFRQGFEELARERRDASFVWLDIEDDAEVAGDIDIESFPTIAVFDRERLVHFGVTLPQKRIVARLIASLDWQSKTVAATAAVAGLRSRLTGRPS